MDCLVKDATKVLKFHKTKRQGFFCSACCTAGYTFQNLCFHLTLQHSENDLIKMGLSSIYVYLCGAPKHVKELKELMAETKQYWIDKRLEHNIHARQSSGGIVSSVASNSPMQQAALPAGISLG